MTVTLIALFIGAFSLQTSIRPIVYARIAVISLFISALISLNGLYITPLSGGLGLWSGLFQISPVSLSIEILIYLTAAFILTPWLVSPINETESIPSYNYGLISKLTGPICSDYSLITLFSVLGATLLISSSDLISMYLSIELQSFALYILATLYKDNESAVSSGLKYFLLGGLSSCFILLGAALLYSYTGLTNIENIFSLILSSNEISSEATPTLGILFIILGFLFKIAAAPLHNWAPDVYDGVPTIVTTWLTIMPKISIIIFLLEIVSLTILGGETHSFPYVSGGAIIDLETNNLLSTISLPLKNILLASALLSLIIGSVVGLAQFKVKRLLAYSTISHVGFLILSLAINSESSSESLLFYLIQYTLSNLNVFLILLAFGYILKSLPVLTEISRSNNLDSSVIDIKYIYELKGQFTKNPLLSLSFALMLFSMAGVPPLIGFFAKQQVLLAATQSGYYFMSIIAILMSVVSAYYYLQIIKVMHFSPVALSTPAPFLQSKVGQEFNTEKDKNSLGNEDPRVNKLANSDYLSVGLNAHNSKDRNIGLISNTHSFIISTLTLGMVLFILNPNILLNSVHLLALTLFYA